MRAALKRLLEFLKTILDMFAIWQFMITLHDMIRDPGPSGRFEITPQGQELLNLLSREQRWMVIEHICCNRTYKQIALDRGLNPEYVIRQMVEAYAIMFRYKGNRNTRGIEMDQATLTITTEQYRNQLAGGLQACGVPRHMWEQMIEYIVAGRPPGMFLLALLNNDLMVCVKKADELNAPRIKDYIEFLEGVAPVGCYGSTAQVSEWTRRGGLLGIQRRREVERMNSAIDDTSSPSEE